MKTVILIRHAKTETFSESGQDFDRRLTERGRNDAKEMAERLKNKNLLPDLIISSTAKRAKQTARIIAEQMDYNKEDILKLDKLYQCTPEVFEEVLLSGIPDNINTLFIIAHNPGISAFALSAVPNPAFDFMPTCGVTAFSFEGKSWMDFATQRHTFVLFDFPKNY